VDSCGRSPAAPWFRPSEGASPSVEWLNSGGNKPRRANLFLALEASKTRLWGTTSTKNHINIITLVHSNKINYILIFP